MPKSDYDNITTEYYKYLTTNMRSSYVLIVGKEIRSRCVGGKDFVMY
jgi:hypothetical protein